MSPSVACPLCGNTETRTREYTLNGVTYKLTHWTCVHPHPEGHGVSLRRD